MNHGASEQGRGAGRGSGGVYVAALLALGLTVGLAPLQRAAGQAVDPVNINGTKAAPPDAAVPGAATPASGSTGAPAAKDGATKENDAAPAAAIPARNNRVAPGAPVAAPAAAAPVAEQPVQAVTPPDVGGAPAAQGGPSVASPETPQPPPAVAAPSAPAPPPPAAPAAAAPVAPVSPPGAAASATGAKPPGETATSQSASDAQTYPITELKVSYYRENPKQPPIGELLGTAVTLGVSDGAYTAPRPGGQTVTVKLSEVGKQGTTKITRSGVAAIYNQIVRFFNGRGISGVFVVVDAKDIDANDRDMRTAGKTSLDFLVVTSVVREIRTVATGDVKTGDRINQPQHKLIIERSPIQAEKNGAGDLFNRNVLDDYLMLLNRQPGRRVDVAVSGTDKPGEVDLDYLVSESRPWYVYTQASNTGTRQTNPWRERFGAVDNQLTGHDDILTIDYLTAGFWASHAVVGSYELPVFDMQRLRYKIFATYNQFTASDVGLNNENFTGDEWTVGNEISLNFFQHRETFVDLVAGFRYQPVETTNVTSGVKGEGNFYVPYVGLRMDRGTEIATTLAQLTLVSYMTDSSTTEIEGLGRTQPSKEPLVLQFQAAQSAFLEPLLFPEQFVAGKSTLAHEIYVGVHGQFGFDYRIFPQAEDVAGGFYSVRGYPESVVAGDSVIVATGEYRFHLPRILPIQADPSKTPFLWDKSFRFSPSQTYGRPDWDFITRAFVDVGQVDNNRRLSFEQNYTLVGTGVGVELQYKQNFNIRVDWGVALQGIPGLVEEGSNRFHISATILY